MEGSITQDNHLPIEGFNQGMEGAIGGIGDDELYGEGGDDILRGNAGTNLLDGGDGDDRLIGYINEDTLLGGEGADILIGGTGIDMLDAGADDNQDRVDGEANVDVCIADPLEDTVLRCEL
jgi:Ca2+-binding RTX toxin-like protein